MTLILELNDADLTLYRDGAAVHRAPGVAVVQGDTVHFGDEALRLARIHPRQANQQYFSRLSAEPLPVPGRRARNHADLVYLHLMTYKPLIEAEGGEILLAVPGVLSPDQLGVLLGVIQEVGIRVRGFVDSAVAAVSTCPAPRHCYHLDVMLQRAVVTTLEVEADVRKTGAQEVQDCGLNRILDGWINVIADRFVQETRFDPLHAAASEQQLFNQVYDWIGARPGNDELVVEITHGDQTRRVELGEAVLAEKAEQRFHRLADALPQGARVFVSARAARLPGLEAALAGLHIDATVLPGDALVTGCLDNLETIVPRDGELRLVTRLPHATGAEEAPAGEAAGPAASGPALQPTHLLRGAEALPLSSAALPLPLLQEQGHYLLRDGDGVRVNGAAPGRTTVLDVGDRIALGDHEYLVIHVHDPASPAGGG